MGSREGHRTSSPIYTDRASGRFWRGGEEGEGTSRVEGRLCVWGAVGFNVCQYCFCRWGHAKSLRQCLPFQNPVTSLFDPISVKFGYLVCMMNLVRFMVWIYEERREKKGGEIYFFSYCEKGGNILNHRVTKIFVVFIYFVAKISCIISKRWVSVSLTITKYSLGEFHLNFFFLLWEEDQLCYYCVLLRTTSRNSLNDNNQSSSSSNRILMH